MSWAASSCPGHNLRRSSHRFHVAPQSPHTMSKFFAFADGEWCCGWREGAGHRPMRYACERHAASRSRTRSRTRSRQNDGRFVGRCRRCVLTEGRLREADKTPRQCGSVWISARERENEAQKDSGSAPVTGTRSRMPLKSGLFPLSVDCADVDRPTNHSCVLALKVPWRSEREENAAAEPLPAYMGGSAPNATAAAAGSLYPPPEPHHRTETNSPIARVTLLHLR